MDAHESRDFAGVEEAGCVVEVVGYGEGGGIVRVWFYRRGVLKEGYADAIVVHAVVGC